MPFNTLISRCDSDEKSPRSARKKKNFPVKSSEQGISELTWSVRIAPETIPPPSPAPAEPDPLAYRPLHATQAGKLYAHGLDDADVADFFEIPTATLDRWRREQPDFAAAIARGKAHADNRVECSLHQRACGYSYRQEKLFRRRGGEEPIRASVQVHVPADARAAFKWLRIRRPE